MLYRLKTIGYGHIAIMAFLAPHLLSIEGEYEIKSKEIMGIISGILYTNKTGLFTKKALDVYVQKQAMINSNIANATTPGYKALEMKPFEQALNRAFKSAKGMKMATTSPKHIGGMSGSLRNFQPQVVKSTEPGRVDGNNVNLDKEVTEMNQNLTMYRAVATARTKWGKMISDALSER